MDLKYLLGVAVAIFLAELGDKTQLAILSCSAARPQDRWLILFGAIIALSLSSLIATLCGSYLSKIISPFWINILAGILFIIMGILILHSAFKMKGKSFSSFTNNKSKFVLKLREKNKK